MRGTLTTIHPNGRRTEVQVSEPVTLEVLQSSVGGWLEIVPGLDKFEGKVCVAYCNEEGKIDRLPVNEPATELWAAAYGCPVEALGDVLVGPIAIVTGDTEFMGAL